MIKQLEEIFYDPKKGLVNFNKFKQKIKEEKIHISNKELKDFYDKQAINQVLKPIKKQKKFNSFVANYAGHIYQIDIMNYDRYSFKHYKYILVVIDIFSRYIQAKPMTNRKLETIIINFENIIKIMGPPYKIEADNEFNRKEFIKLLDYYNIKYKFSDAYEINKNPIVERVNGTIAKMLQKIRVVFKKYDWNNYLDDVIENYNNTIHSTTKHKPIDIFNGQETNEQEYKIFENKFNVGDKVRIINKNIVFKKGDVLKLSTKVYTIENINKNRIKLIDVKKTYKPYELIKVLSNPDDEELLIPENKQLEKKIKRYYKKEGLNIDNIID